MNYTNILITGTGSYVPKNIIQSSRFSSNEFYDDKGTKIEGSHEEITKKFKAITGIEERRYVDNEMVASDIGAIAGRIAIEDAGIDPETIDQLIVAHNFGDVRIDTIQSDSVPSLASRIKHSLGIKNPSCVAYDVLFGCPGWLQGIIQASAYMKAGMAKKCLVIATETLSRVIDKNDRDSMIFADGAGACIVEMVQGDEKEGILGMEVGSWTKEEAHYLFMGKGNSNAADPNVRYIKMFGRKIYEFALKHVPQAMKSCLDKARKDIHDVNKILIHQANEKMDQEIIKRLYRLYKERSIPEGIMPMSIHKLGNSSVATIPTLFDQIRKGVSEEKHTFKKGDLLLFASVGAGMNINAIAYQY
jgi:3-oxoacyl-[acyl-carrier-protein] synthase-3